MRPALSGVAVPCCGGCTIWTLAGLMLPESFASTGMSAFCPACMVIASGWTAGAGNEAFAPAARLAVTSAADIA